MDIHFIIGISAGILTSVSMLPQLIKIIKEKKAGQINIFAFIILCAGLGLWIYYGIIRDDLPLIITNVFAFILNLSMVFISYRFKTKK